MQAELTTARTAEEKELARERRKVKGAQAKMELHQAKAKHAAEKLSSKHHHHHQPPVVGTQPVVGTHANQPVGTGGTMPGTTAPAYPLGGHPPGHGHI